MVLLASAVCLAQNRIVTDAEVQRVHKSLLLIDTHNDVTSETVKGADIGKAGGAPHTDVARLRKGNVGAVFFAVYVSAAFTEGNHAANRTLQMIDTVKHDIVARHSSDFAFATTADQLEAAHRNGKIAALMGIEGGHAIEDSLRLLRTFYDLGIRYMTLTHSNTNNWADSSGDIARHNGLTAFGEDVVREMNRLGMMVDISHVSDKTFWDALEVSKAPIIASHSSCRELTNVPRNMTDEMIKALARKGGVVQINFSCGFVSQKAAGAARPQFSALREKFKNDPAGLEKAIQAEREARAKNSVRATLADVVAHIDHAVKVAGIDHVGIGSDFDGILCTPQGLGDVSEFPNLTKALLEKGYSAGDIGKIYGGNLLRVMRAVEAAAGKGV